MRFSVPLAPRSATHSLGSSILGALLLSAAVVVGSVLADEPPPLYHVSITPDFNGSALVAPGPLAGTTYTVSVRNENNVPIPGLFVEFRFHSDIRICAGAVHTGVTNAAGICLIQLRAGGCIPEPNMNACSVVANGVQIYVFTKVKSPDNASNNSSLPDGVVSIADLVFFAREFQGVVPAGCHDYTNDGQTTTADLPFFADAFRPGLHCNLR